MSALNQPKDPNRFSTANVRVVAINGLKIVADRRATTAEIKHWFEKKENLTVDDFRVVSLLDAHDEGTVSEAVRQIDFESARLPRFL